MKNEEESFSQVVNKESTRRTGKYSDGNPSAAK